MTWKSIRKLFTLEPTESATNSIQEELEDIEMNDLNGKDLSNGLRAHHIGPKSISVSTLNARQTEIFHIGENNNPDCSPVTKV